MKKAFTLIEILVVISIIGILGGIFWANYQGSERHSQLLSARDILWQNMLLARDNSMAGVESEGVLPAGGWGLYFSGEDSSYQVFADLDGDSLYQESEAVYSIFLPEGVEFYKLGAEAGYISETELINSIDLYPVNQPLSLVFSLDDKEWIIQDQDYLFDNLAIILRQTDESATRAIFLNKLGLISGR